ncbi:MAG: DUF1592 domain-containing protein [Bryobacteraceae bacterium]|nr:DUF1592 domain-containing protein [Bryobacteraceae bacterium]
MRILVGMQVLTALALAGEADFLQKNCLMCHSSKVKQGGLDVSQLAPASTANFAQWVKIHDRLSAGEMPPKQITKRPDPVETKSFLQSLSASLETYEKQRILSGGRALDRRLNRTEYENALRDLLQAPWLQVKGQFPEDGEAFRFNKSGEALDISHVHLARYLSAADYAIRQVMSVQYSQPPTATTRFYAREQSELTSKVNHSNQRGDRQIYPILGWKAQPEIYGKKAPFTVGSTDPQTREQEAMAWVSSNYVTGFRYRWDGFRAPVAGLYKVRFSGYTIWVAPLAGKQSHLPDFEKVSKGRRYEPVTVYTRNGVLNRRVGEFDLTPEPQVHEIGQVWLLANETLVPDASRLYRSRPNNFRNPLMEADGAPGVAFRWMEVEGPIYDSSTTAGYRMLFGDLPLKAVGDRSPGVSIPAHRNIEDRLAPNEARRDVATALGEMKVDVVSSNPARDAERLLRGFLKRAYRKPVAEVDVQRFLRLIEGQRAAGLSFAEAMLAGYTAVLASPGFVFVNEQPGRLDDYALATRLSLFLSNSLPDETLRSKAARGELNRPEVLRAETERLLALPYARRFVDAFLDYWIDLRKIEDSTPSASLYNDYYLDDALTEASIAETQLYFEEMVRKNLPARYVVNSDFTFLNDRLALHYGVPGVTGIGMRRVALPADSPRGGFMTQASVLKLTANGTTTSPVLRGKWIMERILGYEVPPPPPVAAVEPDIRGAVTIRQQLDKHRSDASCASCHNKIDPPGFALESFDIMGGWRDRYRAVDEKVPAEKGRGKNGQPFEFHYALPVDSSGTLPDGRAFANVHDFKRLLKGEDETLARNLARQLTVFATGAPVRFGDRARIEQMLEKAKAQNYGVRSLIHEVVQSELFRSK